jgi:hypothetical protein
VLMVHWLSRVLNRNLQALQHDSGKEDTWSGLTPDSKLRSVISTCLLQGVRSEDWATGRSQGFQGGG